MYGTALSIPYAVRLQHTGVETPFDANLMIISCLRALVEVLRK